MPHWWHLTASCLISAEWKQIFGKEESILLKKFKIFFFYTNHIAQFSLHIDVKSFFVHDASRGRFLFLASVRPFGGPSLFIFPQNMPLNRSTSWFSKFEPKIACFNQEFPEKAI